MASDATEEVDDKPKLRPRRPFSEASEISSDGCASVSTPTNSANAVTVVSIRSVPDCLAKGVPQVKRSRNRSCREGP